MPYKEYVENIWVFSHLKSGADPGFQVRGAHLKKNCAERREEVKMLGYFV
jgi:hypothetical protein